MTDNSNTDRRVHRMPVLTGLVFVYQVFLLAAAAVALVLWLFLPWVSPLRFLLLVGAVAVLVVSVLGLWGRRKRGWYATGLVQLMVIVGVFMDRLDPETPGGWGILTAVRLVLALAVIVYLFSYQAQRWFRLHPVEPAQQPETGGPA